jgi:hypothetical protein
MFLAIFFVVLVCISLIGVQVWLTVRARTVQVNESEIASANLAEAVAQHAYDTIKEADMHLFCDRVVHYGVAWTSGDLEQRIGRVDRLGSQIGRRIHAHTAASMQPLPRLGVEFPYLVGTLDMYQVRNVIREKIASDLRLDLGKRKEDTQTADTLGMSYAAMPSEGPGNQELQ